MNSTDFFDLLSEDPERFLALLKKLGIQLWDAQKEAYRAAFKYPEVYVRTANATGKCLALDTPLPTPNGWTTMGEVAIGDTLFDEEGNQCRVVQAFAPFLAEAYRVEFDDGTSIVADGEHLWRALSYDDKTPLRRRKWGKYKALPPLHDWRDAWNQTRAVSTDEMRASLRWRQRAYNWFIPCARAVKTEKTDLSVAPYTLGYWLGDGTKIHGVVTIGHSDRDAILAQIEAEGEKYHVVPSSVRDGCAMYRIEGLQARLRKMGMLGSKAIPMPLLRADTKTRLALFQGIMDADGFNATRRSCGLDTTDREFADGVAELARTMGIKVCRGLKVIQYKGKPKNVYRLYFVPHVPAFRLERKLKRTRLQHNQQIARQTARTVTNIVPVGKRFVRCIEVDSSRHMYLAGEGFVPTHNTFLSGVLGVAFLFCYRPSKVIYIATKIEQSQRQSWMEFLKIYWKVRQFLSEVRDSPLVLPEPLAHKLNLGDDWFATVWGGSHADPEAYHGFHGRNMLIIVDEASGIDDEVRIAVDRCLTGKNNHLVALGNPLRRVGWFYADQQKDAKHRKVLHISALDSPNVVAGKEVVPGLVTAEKIQQRREEYGETSAFWQSAVLGEFPQEASGALIPWNAIDAARVRHIEPDYGRLSIGVDVARYGSDQSVIVVLAGDSIAEISELSKHDTMSVAGWVRDCLRRWHVKTVAVDEPGLGAGVIDRLREDGINVMAWQPGGAPRRKELYLNAKAEAAADLRERFVRNGIAIPDHHRLTQELAGWTYEFMGDGRMKLVDPKKSPDYADAMLIAHWAQGPATLKEKITAGGETYTAKLAW